MLQELKCDSSNPSLFSCFVSTGLSSMCFGFGFVVRFRVLPNIFCKVIVFVVFTTAFSSRHDDDDDDDDGDD